jgi:predicted Zn-dependent peptidase
MKARRQRLSVLPDRTQVAARVTYRSSVLANGVRVVTAELPHMASVAIGIWVGVGSRHENDLRAGTAHFIEHMLFKGTKRRSAVQISQAVEGLGGYLNAFTDEDHTCFYSRARGDYWPELLDVLSDMFCDSAFDPVEIRKEREVIKEELAMYRDQPSEHVQDLLNSIQFPNHPLGRPILGNETVLNKLRRSHLLEHFQTHYIANSTVIAAAGAIEHDALVKALNQRIRLLRIGEDRRTTFPPVDPVAPAFRGETRDSNQTNLALGIRTCARSDERRFGLRILNALLGENMSSRLFQVIREEHGLTYNIQSSLSSWEDTGDLTISAGLSPDELAKTLRLIRRELDRLQDKLPSRKELNRARDYVIGQFDLNLESTESHMMWLGEQWVNFGHFNEPEVIKDRLHAVTPGVVRNLARTFFQPQRLSLALVGPNADGDKFPRQSRNWAK